MPSTSSFSATMAELDRVLGPQRARSSANRELSARAIAAADSPVVVEMTSRPTSMRSTMRDHDDGRAAIEELRRAVRAGGSGRRSALDLLVPRHRTGQGG